MSDDKRKEAADKMAPTSIIGKKEKAAPASGEGKAMTEHTVKEGDTLSAIALKYYGNAGEAYWRHLYEHNKATIGDDPGLIKLGQTFTIPELPEELKK